VVFANVRLRSDEIAPGWNVFGAFVVVQRPTGFGTVELFEMGIAGTAGGPGADSHEPSSPGDGEDDYRCDEQTRQEFAGLEEREAIFAWLVTG
jgi:hypothetical protein